MVKKWFFTDNAKIRGLMRLKTGKWHEVPPSPASKECVEHACPHIDTEGMCPYWGSWDKKEGKAVVSDLWKRRGTCPFLRWSQEEAV